jgi:hypothetical protein
VANPLAKFVKKQSVCHAQSHMTCAEFGLWEQYRKLSHATNQMFEATENTAARFSGESRSSIYRLRSRLVEKGWLVVVKKSKRGKSGRPSATIFQVLDHDQWEKTNVKSDCKTSSNNELLPVPEMEPEALLPVPEVKSSSSRSGILPVPKVEHRFEKNQIENKSRIEKPPTKTLSKNLPTLNADQNAKHVKLAPVPEMKLVDSTPVSEMEPVRTLSEVLDLLGNERAMKLYNRTRGEYTLADAEAELAKEASC